MDDDLFMDALRYFIEHSVGYGRISECGIPSTALPGDRHLEISVALKPLDEFPADWYVWARFVAYLKWGRIVMNGWLCSALREAHRRWWERCRPWGYKWRGS